MDKSVPTPYKVLLGHLGVWNVVWSIFSFLLCQSSTDCGCNQRFHLVPVSCHYYKVHVQKVSVCVITLCCCQVEKKDVFFTTEFILNLVVVKHFKSAILMHSNFKAVFFSSVMDTRCALFYFSILFNNCFHYPDYTVIYINFIFVLL